MSSTVARSARNRSLTSFVKRTPIRCRVRVCFRILSGSHDEGRPRRASIPHICGRATLRAATIVRSLTEYGREVPHAATVAETCGFRPKGGESA